jgi:hypothetical protein
VPGSTNCGVLAGQGVVNLVRPSAAGMIDGLISVVRGWVDGRRCAVAQGVPVPSGDHQSLRLMGVSGTGHRSSTGAPGGRFKSGGPIGPRRMIGGDGGLSVVRVGGLQENAAGGWPDPPVKTPRIYARGKPISARNGVPVGSVRPGWRNSCPMRPWNCWPTWM